MMPMLADATVANANTMWLAVIAGSSVLANLATVGYFMISMRKTRAEVTFGFEPASKKDVEADMAENARQHLEIFHEINRLKAENLEMTKEIGQITNQTLSALANAHKILNR